MGTGSLLVLDGIHRLGLRELLALADWLQELKTLFSRAFEVVQSSLLEV